MNPMTAENNSLEGRFETIFNHVNEGILISDSSGNIVVVNPKVEFLFGYSGEELQGQKVEILIPHRFHENHVKYRTKFSDAPVKRPMGKDMTLFAHRKDGSEFPVEVSLSYYKTSEGSFVIAFIIDITERFEQQQKIQKINQELTQLNETLERKVYERTLVLKEALNSLEQSRNQLSIALEKEKELNEMKSRFISMASHEFRTPLSTVLSSISLIGKYTKEDEQDKREKHIMRTKRAINNLTEILNDFLSIGKLEEGLIKTHFIDLDVPHFLEELVSEMMAIALPGQQITYHHEGVKIFYLDHKIFLNIMLNLIANAIKFSPENTEINVTSKIDEEGLHVAVRDHGIGISEEDQKYLFDRFYRGKNVSNIEGTGLGLSIVVKYLELMRGHISFESKLGKGTKFTFFIPYLQHD